jgi:hypothetical protein
MSIENKEKEREDLKSSFLCGVGIEKVDITDLETSKHIKELGFNLPTHWYWLDENLPYVEKGLYRVKMDKRRMNHNNYDSFIYSAPTREELLKWENNI